jgi:hypothetical protein
VLPPRFGVGGSTTRLRQLHGATALAVKVANAAERIVAVILRHRPAAHRRHIASWN